MDDKRRAIPADPRRAQRRDGFPPLRQGRARAFYWLDGGFAYAVAGEVREDTLLAIANVSYRQFLAAQGRSGPEGS